MEGQIEFTAGHRSKRVVWLLPLLLTGYFFLASLCVGPVHWMLIAIVLAYTTVPVACAYWGASDFLIVALLWLPLEFPAPAAQLIAKHGRDFCIASRMAWRSCSASRCSFASVGRPV